ncbi:hypothetical protein FEM48_Zijuj03G0075600 [Ziziphus jujuba var. spinosa]|uniref:Uncharacterized protein n=1 Tax=Ziziphus jujuba var. spinosa TaxID=714518 RepID=A0A978VP01_ZIZJJ|nr:hypothetical protein FEM48_Zijuj03G0075600 [Ziziphus jujuba var. spinosa]
MYVDLSSNKFVGPFPKSCWNLTRLKSLNVASNDMNSSLAIWLSGLSSSSSSLVSLDLSFNSLQGLLPCSNQNLTALRYLYLTGCELNSTIISSGFLNDLVRLEYLFLDNNNIELSAIQNLKSLVQLELSQNSLKGEMPTFMGNLVSLVYLDLSFNSLEGEIPTSLGNLCNLSDLSLGGNKFGGKVSNAFDSLLSVGCLSNSLTSLDLSENSFTAIPKWMGTSLLNLTILILRSNNLSGHIPLELCSLTALQILDVADNNLSGTMPKCFDNLKAMTIKQVLKDVISYSNFVGYFFEQVMVVTRGREDQYDTILPLVNSLDLSSNKLIGEIPRQLTTLQGLISLNLSGNFLKGRIPDSIGNMVWLESLDLSRNRLSGKIPLSTQLQSFDASSFIGNELCGQPLSTSVTKTSQTHYQQWSTEGR